MSAANQIHEVYIYSGDETKELHERDGATLDLLTGVLASLAIERVATPAEADAMVVVGGDGTFLHGLRQHQFPNIPVTGVNTGTLGFYMDTVPTEEAITKMAQQLASGAYMTRRLPLLEVPVGQREELEYAANEVVVERDSAQAFKASLQLDQAEFEHFVGDGFIFGTPQGSTSQSLSAGGSILGENIDGYIVAPSNPHKSLQYYSLPAPVVVSRDTQALVKVKEAERRPFKVSVDYLTLRDWPEDEHEVRIRVSSDKALQIIRFEGHDYFVHVSAAFRGKQC